MKYEPCDAALLDAFIDGELSPEQAAAMQAHLSTCSDCQAYWEAALAIRDAFPTAEDADVPAGFADGVMAAIRLDSRKKRKTHWARVLAPLAACFAIVVVLRIAPMGGNTTEGASLMAVDRAAAPAEDSAAGLADTDAASTQSTSDESAEAAQDTESKMAPMLAGEGPSPYSIDPYSARVYLTAEEAGTLLDGFTGFAYEDNTVSGTAYELTSQEYAVLSAALPAAALDEAPDTGVILVVVTP